MTDTNKVIAEWLGKKKYPWVSNAWFLDDESGELFTPDFPHSRDQQGWIEDELEKRGYTFSYSYYPFIKEWHVLIHNYNVAICIPNKSKDQAFIEAVLELIEKEGK